MLRGRTASAMPSRRSSTQSRWAGAPVASASPPGTRPWRAPLSPKSATTVRSCARAQSRARP
ncbi:MAG: hypothetical protein ACK56F_31570, partial [bacterium]